MKNTKSISFILFLSLIVILVISCKKSTMNNDLTVTINSPVEGRTYTGSVEMSFSINAPNGIDSCYIALTDASGSTAYYSNNFLFGTTVQNTTSFTYADTQTALPSTLTSAKFIISVVDLKMKRFSKTINLSVIQ